MEEEKTSIVDLEEVAIPSLTISQLLRFLTSVPYTLLLSILITNIKLPTILNNK
jgi:hypothetical protein